MKSLHMHSLLKPEPQWVHTKGHVWDKRPTTNITFFHISFAFSCHLWFERSTDKKKTSRAPFGSLPWNNAWTCSGLQVGVTQEKTWKEGISIYENEKEVIRCNVWELITLEKRTVVLWRMTQRGGLISSTCYPEGFSSLWERDKCIRETKEGRMKHRTELIRWETKEQKEAYHIIVVSTS